MEIERKFLVKTIPTSLGEGTLIRQGYLSIGDPEERVREKSFKGKTTFVRTIKSGSGLSREEREWAISQAEFLQAWEMTMGHRVEKTRYKIPLVDDLIAELDIYSGSNAGLVVVEVEFPDFDTAESFTLPEWFGEDVTEDPTYKNKNLAR